MELDELLLHLLRQTIRGPIQPFIDLCSSVRLPVENRSRLLLEADLILDRNAMHKLRQALSRRLLERSVRGSLYESAEGYEKETDGSVTQISNFTIRLDSVIGFSALAEINYRGIVTIGAITFPFDLSNREFDTPLKLEQALQAKQLLRPGGSGILEAVVFITQKNAFKQVLDWLRLQASQLPRSRGYKNLGWTRRHDLYITPHAAVDSAGVTFGVNYCPKPDSDHLCFTSDGDPLPPYSGTPRDMPPLLAELVSGCVAHVVRYYHGLQVRPIPIRNNHEGRVFGKRLFAGFGQADIFRPTSIVPSNLEINRGMPCLTTGINELQAGRLAIAGLYLSDSGPDLSSLTESQVGEAACALWHLVLEITRKLTAGESTSYREKRSVKPLAALAVEGADLIRKDFWPEWPEAGVRWQAVDGFLEGHQDKLSEVVTVDDTKDELVILPGAWTKLKIDQTDLLIELGLLCSKVTCKEDEGIRVDRPSFYRVLGDYYGDVPRLVAAV